MKSEERSLNDHPRDQLGTGPMDASSGEVSEEISVGIGLLGELARVPARVYFSLPPFKLAQRLGVAGGPPSLEQVPGGTLPGELSLGNSP